MIDKSIIDEVSSYMTEERVNRYTGFCTAVVDQCDSIKQELGPNVVSRVYSRLDKQGGAQLKSSLKIAKKVMERRAEGLDFNPCDVTDIVGATIVVQYPDQINQVIGKLRERVNADDITMKVEVIERPGYYATHVDLYSVLDFRAAYCELQIKTMLHDSWSAKMHDLNYKPQGSLDNRLDRLMSSLGSTLQAIEVQSETLRNLIQERWQQEKFWRQLVGKHTIGQLREFSTDAGLFGDGARAVFEEIDRLEEEVINWRHNDDPLVAVTRKVSLLSKPSAREAWWIATYLAVLSRRPNSEDFAIELIQDWLEEASRLLTVDPSNIHHAEVFFAPLSCQALGHNEVAIDLSEKIIELFDALGLEDIKYAKFNLIHFLLEREYFLPSKPDLRMRTAERVRSLAEDCETMRAEDPSSFHDMEGMEKVVFGTSAEEVRQGIDLIEMGKDTLNEREAEYASETYELHARLAWRRLGEIENAIG